MTNTHNSPYSGKEIVKKLDSLLDRDLGDEADVFLREMLSRVRECGDWQTEITVLNEMMGFYRNRREEEAGLRSVCDGFALLREHGIREGMTAGTTLLNAATTLKAFGRTEESLPYYEEVWRIYGACLAPEDYRMAGLCNNMALCYLDLGRFREADVYFNKAVSVMQGLPNSTLEIGVTYVNLAVLADKSGCGEKEVSARLQKAWNCFTDEAVPHNAYFAFNCRKCAGTFGYYGFFVAEEMLTDWAEEIYRKNREKHGE